MTRGLCLFLWIFHCGCAERESTSVTALIEKLTKGNHEEQLLALYALGELGPKASPAVPTLTKKLEDKNAHIRAGAAVTLGYIGPDAKTAIPALLSTLKDGEKNVRAASASALSGIGVKEKKILLALHDALNEPDALDRVEIAESLARLDPDSDVAISTVTNVLLKDEDPGNRSWAALSLGNIKSSKIAVAIPCLITALNDKSASVRTFAAQSLGKYGPDAKAAIPSLTRALQDSDNDVRSYAAQSIRQISAGTKKREEERKGRK
jgi:HEAT repeat protein